VRHILLKNLGVLVFVCVGSILSSCSSHLERSLKKVEVAVPTTLTPSATFGSFQDAKAITADGLGNIFVLDNTGPSIIKYNIDGDSLMLLTGRSSNEFGFDTPQDIDGSLGNFLAVADYGNNRIQFYNRDLVWQFGFEGIRGVTRDRLFAFPLAVSMSATGVCYLIDGEGKRTVKLAPQTSQVIPVGSLRTSAFVTDPVSLVLDGRDNTAVLNRDGLLVIINTVGEVVAAAELPDVSDKDNAKRKVSRVESDILVVNATPGVIVRISFTDLAVTSSYHISGADLDIRDVAYYRGKLYVLTQQKVLVCSISH
jgi:hypothetical protein